MKNNIDFIYEYSDLNPLHTRIQILTGEYAGIVFELGGSMLAQVGDSNKFTFDYVLYELPDQFYGPSLKANKKFNEFLAYLIVDVIDSRNQDPQEHSKLMEAAKGVTQSAIKINPKYYFKASVI
jgi:hypothetical protein